MRQDVIGSIAGWPCIFLSHPSDNALLPSRFRIMIKVLGAHMRGYDGHEFEIRGLGENLRKARRDALELMRFAGIPTNAL